VPTLKETSRQILALPREAGTAEIAAARALVAAHLKGLGYTVVFQKFSFAPSSLRAFPVFGDGLGLLALILFPLLGTGSVPAWSALAVWTGGLAATAIVAAGVGLGWVPFGEGTREDANLIATRGDDRPRRWIVAHLDSKAQGHSMAGRLVAVWITLVAIAMISLMAGLRLNGPIAPVWLGLGGGTALLAGFLARRGRLRGRSLGARDNGTGVVAALAAAEVAPAAGFGILITGAEEFGLVGARVFARLTPDLQETEFVNVDTVDQEGMLYLVSHDARGERLARRIEPVLARLGVPLRHRRLPLGIFVDSAPLSQARAPSITIGRLTWNTLRRIHTAADTPDDLSFDTAVKVGRAVAHSIDVSTGAG
jgi:Peptidase family M28